MKRFLILFTVFALTLCFGFTTAKLTWFYHPDPVFAREQDIRFLILSTTNLNQPMKDWPVIAILPGTAREYQIGSIVGEPHRFFTVQVTNVVTGLSSDLHP